MTEEVTGDRQSAEAGADTERARRGASFPTMDLASVVEVIHKVGGHGGEFSVSAFAQYCGHQTANSGPFRTKFAAFRDWSLVTKNKDGRVLLTDLGQDVARSPEPLTDKALLSRVFDACATFKTFYDNQAKGVPIKAEVLGRAATFDLKVAAKSQDRFVKTLVDSAVTVGLASVDADASTVTFNAARPAGVEPAQPEAEAPATHAAPAPHPAAVATGAAAAPVATSAAPVLLRQVWPTATGEVILAIHSTDPLPAAAFGLVGTVVQAAEELAKSIGLPAAEEPAEPEDDDAA